jgi:7-cyano-7-deazaguanine synthase
MKIAVLLSGGIDSATLLYSLNTLHSGVEAVCIDYGQKHYREMHAAMAIAKSAGVPLKNLYISLEDVFLGAKCSQVGQNLAVPHGHYADETMKVTVVPNRNMLLIAIASAYTASREGWAVAYAAHAGDHPIYPDCRPEFAETLRRALKLGCNIELMTPFITWTKSSIVQYGQRLGVPFDLTYSCYEGREKHCGRCGTCVERREAFKLAGVYDPTEYEVGESAG